MPGVRVLHGYTRDRSGRPDRLLRRRAPGGRDARSGRGLRLRTARARRRGPRRTARTRDSRASSRPCSPCRPKPSGGRVAFADSGVDVTDDGRPLLEQAEAAGLTPESGCRMGICHTCTRRKTSGAVQEPDHRRGLDAPTRRTCRSASSAPVGDVEIAL